MRESTQSLQRAVTWGLSESAAEFVRHGLDAFHKNRRYAEVRSAGFTAGCLVVGIELMLKALIAQIDLLTLFTRLPSTTRIHIARNNTAPDELVALLRDGAATTMDLNEAVQCLYVALPGIDDFVKPYLEDARYVRNNALHFYVVNADNVHVYRIAYCAILLARGLRKQLPFVVDESEADKAFVKEFNEKRAERVKCALHNARKRAKKLREPVTLSVDGDDVRTTRCPVCKSDATVFGSVNDECFWIEAFECDGCKLKLDHMDEIPLAGLPKLIDEAD